MGAAIAMRNHCRQRTRKCNTSKLLTLQFVFSCGAHIDDWEPDTPLGMVQVGYQVTVVKFFMFFALNFELLLISETLGIMCAGLARNELVGMIILATFYVPLLMFTGFIQVSCHPGTLPRLLSVSTGPIDWGASECLSTYTLVLCNLSTAICLSGSTQF